MYRYTHFYLCLCSVLYVDYVCSWSAWTQAYVSVTSVSVLAGYMCVYACVCVDFNLAAISVAGWKWVYGVPLELCNPFSTVKHGGREACAHCHAELHGLMITLSGPGPHWFIQFTVFSVHSQLISFSPACRQPPLCRINLIYGLIVAQISQYHSALGSLPSHCSKINMRLMEAEAILENKIGCLLPVGLRK